MDYEIKILNTKDLPYDQLSNLYSQTYLKSHMEDGSLNWNPDYVKFFFNSAIQYRELFFTAWKENQLIATIIGVSHPIVIEGTELKSITLALGATIPEYQGQGIQKSLVNKLISKAKDLGFDLIYALPAKGLGGVKLLKQHFGFISKNKNARHEVKILGDYGIYCLKNYRRMNVLMAKLAESLYSKKPKDEFSDVGLIRDADINKDLNSIIELGNSYNNHLTLSEKFYLDKEKPFIEGLQNISNLGDPYNFYWKVWDIDGKIVANICLRSELIHFMGGKCALLIVSHLFFDQNLTDIEKIGFYAEIIRQFWPDDAKDKGIPELFLFNVTCVHHEQLIHKKLNFTSEPKNYELLVLPLTDKGEIINNYKKIKDFHLSYMR
ncbi:MAG: GNAT family N-acetyltransferase [Candidatus Helarchaeota archaeon]